MVLYEYPFNERVRTLLRLEKLFDSMFFFVRQPDARGHHVAVTTLFEILDVSARADLKSDLLQDLERYRQSLHGLREHPGVDREALGALLSSIEEAAVALNHQGKTGDPIRQNDWLTSIRSRLAIPGGVCEFDLPAYHAWRHKPAQQRVNDLAQWVEPFLPLREGLTIVLKMLRESSQPQPLVAEEGAYRQMLGGKAFQLLRVYVEEGDGIFPEISANKYMVSIRFSIQGGDMKPQHVQQDVPFQLALCNSI
ncbi:cell division protein ZapD [Pigmentiphaga litoralis]|uniref:cell division protein ZapD n=1 Tax=Pigmentiphaga litoralis TaxID=516702 RepID=UPI0016744677|nr:cell division protein ZapD [Pigmentiphaga litoralis]GGX16728.1 cell division protein ZapD [Pigmentiphaga litoralis]